LDFTLRFLFENLLKAENVGHCCVITLQDSVLTDHALYWNLIGFNFKKQ
jgi:hypothetical protein